MAGGVRAGSVALPASATPASARSAGVFAGRAREGEIAGLQRARLLMSIIALPYLGAGAARREMSRPLPRASLREGEDAIAAFEGPDPLSELPIRLTYRTAKVLQSVAQLTGQGAPASNRRVANQAGVNDPGQISKLLARLKEHGLLENAAAGGHVRGEANQWRLTESGRRVVQSITTQAGPSPQRSAA